MEPVNNQVGAERSSVNLRKVPHRRTAAGILMTLAMLLGVSGVLQAQDGLFIKLSVGPGIASENSQINGTGFTAVTKNHGIGWGFGKYGAVYLGEFGGLINLKSGEFQFINLDTFGLGYTFILPEDLSLSVAGGYGMVAFARNWTDPFGDSGGTGYGLSLNLDKTWSLWKQWKLSLGPQGFLLHAGDRNYRFINFSMNLSISFFLTPLEP